MSADDIAYKALIKPWQTNALEPVVVGNPYRLLERLK